MTSIDNVTIIIIIIIGIITLYHPLSDANLKVKSVGILMLGWLLVPNCNITTLTSLTFSHLLTPSFSAVVTALMVRIAGIRTVGIYNVSSSVLAAKIVY